MTFSRYARIGCLWLLLSGKSYKYSVNVAVQRWSTWGLLCSQRNRLYPSASLAGPHLAVAWLTCASRSIFKQSCWTNSGNLDDIYGVSRLHHPPCLTEICMRIQFPILHIRRQLRQHQVIVDPQEFLKPDLPIFSVSKRPVYLCYHFYRKLGLFCNPYWQIAFFLLRRVWTFNFNFFEISPCSWRQYRWNRIIRSKLLKGMSQCSETVARYC